MSHAPSQFYPLENGGYFRESETDNFFEYSAHNNFIEDTVYPEFQHRVFVDNEGSWRYAKILKKTAYIIVDINDYGEPVIEKWQIKNHRRYNI